MSQLYCSELGIQLGFSLYYLVGCSIHPLGSSNWPVSEAAEGERWCFCLPKGKANTHVEMHSVKSLSQTTVAF